jgi:hypothetical protein
MESNMPNWTKRKLQTYQFKGRPRRALLWRKSVYEEWFHYIRLYHEHTGKRLKRFKDWGDIDSLSFADWWKHPDHGFELFCEPDPPALVRVIDGRNKPEPNTIDLRVVLNADIEITMRDLRKTLSESGAHSEYQSQARYQPSQPMAYIKPDKLRQARYAFEVSESSVNQNYALDILANPKKFSVAPKKDGTRRLNPYLRLPHQEPQFDESGRLILKKGTYAVGAYPEWRLSKLRTLSYHRKAVREIFDALEHGFFPTIS